MLAGLSSFLGALAGSGETFDFGVFQQGEDRVVRFTSGPLVEDDERPGGGSPAHKVGEGHSRISRGAGYQRERFGREADGDGNGSHGANFIPPILIRVFITRWRFCGYAVAPLGQAVAFLEAPCLVPLRYCRTDD